MELVKKIFIMLIFVLFILNHFIDDYVDYNIWIVFFLYIIAINTSEIKR